MKTTKEKILRETRGGLKIYCAFIPDLKVQGNSCKNVCNPFYEDGNASLSIYKRGDRWYFNDFGDPSYKGDIFKFSYLWYKNKYNLKLEFPQLLEKLEKEILSTNSVSDPVQVHEPDTLSDERGLAFRLHELAEFSDEGHEFFSQYGISAAVLQRYNVSQLLGHEVFQNNEWKLCEVGGLTFAFTGKSFAKLYSPNPKRFSYLGKKPKDYVYGIEQLPECAGGEVVIVTGGEKDVLTLSALGYNAICLNSETARPPQALQRELFDRQLQPIVMYDIDSTGIKYGNIVATDLGCNLIVLPDLLKQSGGKDISDWIRLKLPVEELRKIIEEGGKKPQGLRNEFQESRGVDIPAVLQSNIITGEELLNMDITEIPMLISPIFHRIGLAAIAGSSDTGKSSFLRQLAIEISTGGKEFLGFPITPRHQSCIYVSTEDDKEAMGFLLRKQNQGKKLERKRYQGLRYIFTSENLAAELDKELTKRTADAVIIDAYADIFPGEINQSNKVRCFLSEFSNLAHKHECLIIFLHHTGKNAEEKEPSKHNLLGSQGFESKVRMVIELRKDLTDTNIRHICVVKGNYIGSEIKSQSYVLEFNSDMLFNNTGRRAGFETLVKKSLKDDNLSARMEEARELRKKGVSLRKISEEVSISKSTLDRKFKEENL